MMKKKKNRFWLFIFSLWPGAGHMYMGFMKMGVSLMMGFMLLIAVVGITNIGVLAVFPLTLYLYSFFHANNLGGLDDEQFAAVEDEYLFGLGSLDYSRFKLDRKGKNILAAVLIVLGVYMLWDVGFGILRDYIGYDNPVMKAIYYTMRDDVPRLVVAIAIIWFGIALLRGKKTVNVMEETPRQMERIIDVEPKEVVGQEWKTEAGSAEASDGTDRADETVEEEQANQVEEMNPENQSDEMERGVI